MKPDTTREQKLERILRSLIKRIKEEKENVGIMGGLVLVAEYVLDGK